MVVPLIETANRETNLIVPCWQHFSVYIILFVCSISSIIFFLVLIMLPCIFHNFVFTHHLSSNFLSWMALLIRSITFELTQFVAIIMNTSNESDRRYDWIVFCIVGNVPSLFIHKYASGMRNEFLSDSDNPDFPPQKSNRTHTHTQIRHPVQQPTKKKPAHPPKHTHTHHILYNFCYFFLSLFFLSLFRWWNQNAQFNSFAKLIIRAHSHTTHTQIGFNTVYYLIWNRLCAENDKSLPDRDRTVSLCVCLCVCPSVANYQISEFVPDQIKNSHNMHNENRFGAII